MDRKDLQEIITETLAIEAEEAKRAGRLGYMARALIQATLPHKAAPSNEFVRDNGLFSLTIIAPSKVGLPYGSIPRLLLSWMTTEAVHTRCPILELGPTLSAFMAELGLSRQGGKRGDITRFKKQAESLFCSTIHCHYADEAGTELKNLMIADEAHLWWNPKSPDQLPLWKSTVTLTDKFFKEIIERPVPVDMDALKALKRSPMALDIYFWLTYRMSYLSRDTVIPWPLLQGQFGADYAHDVQGQRNFKKFFIKRLAAVKAIYEQAKVAPMDKGLLLKPSAPHVAKRPVPMLGGVRREPKSLALWKTPSGCWRRQKSSSRQKPLRKPSAQPLGLMSIPWNRIGGSGSPKRASARIIRTRLLLAFANGRRNSTAALKTATITTLSFYDFH